METSAITERPLLSQAVQWRERLLDTRDPAVHRTFEAWLAVSEEHARAYADVSRGRGRTRPAGSMSPFSVVPSAFRHEAALRAMPMRKPARAKRVTILAAALLLAIVALAAWGVDRRVPQWSDPTRGETFHTEIGQQTDVTLPDGSVATLDTASSLKVDFTRSERRVVLEGQGWFDIEPSTQPFVIEAGGRTFTAMTGAFDIRADPGDVRAFAATGTMTTADGTSSVALQPGHMLTARRGGASISKAADPAVFAAWRTGLLLFNDVPLADAVRELDRYRRRPIRIADRRAAALPISGAFRTGDTPAVVDMLTTQYPVRVTQDDDRALVVASR